MARVPTRRIPTHPGEILFEEFITPLKPTWRGMANSIHVTYQHINYLVNGRRGVTVSTPCAWRSYLGTRLIFGRIYNCVGICFLLNNRKTRSSRPYVRTIINHAQSHNDQFLLLGWNPVFGSSTIFQ